MTEPTQSWQPPVAPPVQPAPPGQPVRPSLPGSVTAAAIILFVFAGLGGLMSGLFLVSGSMYDQIPNSGSGLSDEQFRAAMAMGRNVALAFGLIGLAVAGAHVLAGVGILRRAGWGRIMGIVLAVLAVLLSGFVVLSVAIAATQSISPATLGNSGLTAEQYRSLAGVGMAFGLVLFGGVLVCYLFVLIALIRGGRAFD
jgi:hypothetical protein